jgi:hypothetical protein
MNRCPKGHFIPDNALACPTCAAERGEESFRRLQLEFLRKAVRGDFNYTLRIAKGSGQHVLMYSSYTRTFCGQELSVRLQIAYEPYSVDTLAKICSGCRIAITSAVKEAMGQ